MSVTVLFSLILEERTNLYSKGFSLMMMLVFIACVSSFREVIVVNGAHDSSMGFSNRSFYRIGIYESLPRFVL